MIELMIVLLIVGILVGIALPTFLVGRARSQDLAAQQALRNSVALAKVERVETRTYTGVGASRLATAEPSFTFVDGTVDSTGPKVISVEPVSSTVWVAAALSNSGVCFGIKDSVVEGVTYGKDPVGACKAHRLAAEVPFAKNGWG